MALALVQENSLRGMVRQLSIDQLDNEGRRVSIYEKGGENRPSIMASPSPVFTVRGCSCHGACRACGCWGRG